MWGSTNCILYFNTINNGSNVFPTTYFTRATTWRHANSSWRHVSVHTRNPWLSLHQQEMHQGQTHTQFTFRRLNVNCAVNYSKTESACSAAICTVSALLYTTRTIAPRTNPVIYSALLVGGLRGPPTIKPLLQSRSQENL